MNNIKLFISTTGLISPVIFDDLGKRTFSHPTTDYEITQEYTFEELFDSNDIKSNLDSGNITFKDVFGNSILTSEELYQASMIPKAVKQVKSAGEIIFGHRAVVIISDLVYLFDPTNINHYGKCVGVSNNAANIGDSVEIVSDGQILRGTIFTSNTTYYAGAGGILTNVMPVSGIRQVMGFSIDNESMIVRINRSVKLA